ncbi:Bud site selection protein, Revert to axial protein 1 [Savitreella phatthalungensis]
MTSSENRLPTLIEVLARRTQAPVDLYAFYIYMRDQQRSVDYLDCFLDISQHLALCRLYVRELRRSVLMDTPDGERPTSAMRGRSPTFPASAVHEEMGRFNDRSDQDLSPYLRDVREKPSEGLDAADQDNVSEHSYDYRQARQSYLSEGATAAAGAGHISPEHTINRRDIRASAERILYAYLIQGAEREIALPQHITQSIAQAIEVDGRDDPEVFDEARDYIFQAMEREAFPGFLRARALGNLVPSSAIVRLVIGLLALLGAFWTGFALIFLDYSRATRVWTLLPFFVGAYGCLAYEYQLDPVLALLGLSEMTFGSFVRIKEPYVRSLLARRSLWVLALVLLIAGILTIIFSTVPSTRL